MATCTGMQMDYTKKITLHPINYILVFTREMNSETILECKCQCNFWDTISKIIEKCV